MTMTEVRKSDKSDFDAWRRRQISLVDDGLEKILAGLEQGQPPEVARLVAAMRYAVLGPGKRLRPLLALAAAEAVGGTARQALPAALAVEMVHAYSLIHDDLPALDNDDLRRGRPTCHKAFGEALALLAGDALLTLAFETLTHAGRKDGDTARRALQAAVSLARAAGTVGMVGGQVLDLAFERRPKISGEMVRDMEIRKTGELMSAALACGAWLAGGGPAAVTTFRALGLELGLAFQIRDDLLNLSGDPDLLGKAVGSDAQRGKASFPAIFGRETAEGEGAALAARALDRAAAFKRRGRRLVQLIDSLTNRQK